MFSRIASACCDACRTCTSAMACSSGLRSDVPMKVAEPRTMLNRLPRNSY